MPSHPTGPAADARSLRPGGLLPLGRARLAGRRRESRRAPPGPDDRPALFEAWAQLLRRLAAEQPLLLLLDDLHWADPACLDLLLYVRRRVRDARLLILAAYREGEVGSDDAFQHALVELNRLRLATPLHLDRLDRAATASLLDGLLGSPIAPRLAGLVYRESEGNPFFVEEIVRGLVERDRLVNRMGAWDLADEAAGALPA